MTDVLVLACDGAFDIRRAIAALRRSQAVDVVTMTVDIGQAHDVRATRDTALAAGAVRAHVFEALEEFVRDCVLPVLQLAPAPVPLIASRATLAYPIIAGRLVDVAHLERARIVAHGGGEELSAAIRRLDPSLQILCIDAARLSAQRLSGAATPSRHLLQRPVLDPSLARGVAATVEIEFDDAIPVAVNGVTLALPELLESLSILGGEHGIGHAESANAPGALVLDAAYRALARRSGIVRIELLDGQQRIVEASAATRELVNHA